MKPVTAWRHVWLYELTGGYVTSLSDLPPDRFIEGLVPRPAKLERSQPLVVRTALDEAVVAAAERLERALIAGMDEEYRDDLRAVLDALSEGSA